jgi:hypothetical protein
VTTHFSQVPFTSRAAQPLLFAPTGGPTSTASGGCVGEARSADVWVPRPPVVISTKRTLRERTSPLPARGFRQSAPAGSWAPGYKLGRRLTPPLLSFELDHRKLRVYFTHSRRHWHRVREAAGESPQHRASILGGCPRRGAYVWGGRQRPRLGVKTIVAREISHQRPHRARVRRVSWAD